MVKTKCKAPTSPDCVKQIQHNNCKKKLDPQEIFRKNTLDVTSALVTILKVCGINEHKADTARCVIIDAFNKYDLIRHRIDFVPKKQIRKEDLIHDLGTTCEMTLMEAQLTYAIMKRAFKAFYNGTRDFSIRNPILDAQLIHSQACLWVHAAKRTAEIFAQYEGMFFSTQKKYEELIKRVYICLYDRLQKRAKLLNVNSGCCKNDAKIELTDDEDRTVSAMASELIRNPVKEKPSGGKLHHVQMCGLCKCPKLMCDCNIDLRSNILNLECSQGPFVCRWVRVYDDEPPSDPCIKEPEDHICPVDCAPLSELSSENESEIVCEVEDEAALSALDDLDVEENETVDVSEDLSRQASFICEPPVPDMTPIMLPDKVRCFFYKNEKNILKSDASKFMCAEDLLPSSFFYNRCKCEPTQKSSNPRMSAGAIISKVPEPMEEFKEVEQVKIAIQKEKPLKQNGRNAKKRVQKNKAKKNVQNKRTNNKIKTIKKTRVESGIENGNLRKTGILKIDFTSSKGFKSFDQDDKIDNV